MIELDGATGEGGGQILRTALTLAMITGKPFRIKNIRANRSKPGLMRQHLVAVQSAARISGADVSEAQVGSTTLHFAPKRVHAGDYVFAIGSAGSCTLVLQTLVPALLLADGPSTLRITGGTHNPMAPPAHFLERSYGRALAAMGAQVDFKLERCGFYPAGGGVLVVTITPCPRLRPLDLIERGALVNGYAEAIVAGISASVGTRELQVVGEGMQWDASQLHMRGRPGNEGPGNALLLTLEFEHVTEVVSAVGEKMVRAETVAAGVLGEAKAYLASNGAVGEHLADQLMLPLALAGGGQFSTVSVSQHALTNAQVIERFLPVAFRFEQEGDRHIIKVMPAQVSKTA
ncbi:MAG: RNA 3'-terminal phosphate cyclase [Massilia sp.]